MTLTARRGTVSTAPVEMTERTVLEELARRLEASDAVELTEGGSPARLVKMRTGSGAFIVLKLLVDRPGVVDGHDLASFRQKICQIKKVRQEVPGLDRIYGELNQEFHGANWSAYTMPFYSGDHLGAALRTDAGALPRFWDDLRRIVSEVSTLGYMRSSCRPPPGYISLVHVQRIARRHGILQKSLPDGLADVKRMIINGVSCRNPLENARRLVDSGIIRRIDPVRLYYPVHGDLNIRNILVGRGGYRLIDPRGTIDHWDPAYDISKMLFSFTVWDGALRSGFDITRGDEWLVNIRGGIPPGYRAAARCLMSQLRRFSAFAELTEGDEGWDDRYLVGHAFHLLAEAACRLSDLKRRRTEAASEPISTIELSAGHYLFGALLLEDAVRQLEADGHIDAVKHFELLGKP
jgi:hypothetical protein